jgi:hypothetical protein
MRETSESPGSEGALVWGRERFEVEGSRAACDQLGELNLHY